MQLEADRRAVELQQVSERLEASLRNVSTTAETFRYLTLHINVGPRFSTANGEREPLCRLTVSSALVDFSMGFHKCFVRLTSNTASLTKWMYPFRRSVNQGDEPQAVREFVSVEIRLLSGEHTFLRIVSTPPLRGLKAFKPLLCPHC